MTELTCCPVVQDSVVQDSVVKSGTLDSCYAETNGCGYDPAPAQRAGHGFVPTLRTSEQKIRVPGFHGLAAERSFKKSGFHDLSAEQSFNGQSRVPSAEPAANFALVPEALREQEGFYRVARWVAKIGAGGTGGMSRSDEYRRFAAACVKIAKAIEDGQRQSVFLKMAEVWLDLARKAETKSDRPAADPDNVVT
jgi:hypothetical protein